MAIVTGQGASVSWTRDAATAVVAPPALRITIWPDPGATPAEQAASAAVVTPVPSSYVTVPGLISGVYE